MLDVHIRTKGFSQARGSVRPVLHDIHFTAGPGEVLALLGPSGTGKSTILRIILGLDRDYDGAVSLSAGRIGVMFQEPRLLPWLTVADNLRLVRAKGVPPPDTAELLTEVLLPPVGNLMPAALSLGMARRVALARALAVAPDVLVLDEPFASLDPGLAAGLGARIADRARRLRTLVLLSTHEPAQALAIASRILVIAGSPATLLADVPVPDGANSAAIQQLHQDLLTRFTFLGRSRTDDNAAPPA